MAAERPYSPFGGGKPAGDTPADDGPTTAVSADLPPEQQPTDYQKPEAEPEAKSYGSPSHDE